MAAPSIPQNVFVTQGNGQVYLQWDLVAGATTYPIQRSTDGVTFSPLASPAVNYYLDTTVSPNTRYYYQVASSNGTVSSYSQSQFVIPTLAGSMCLAALRVAAQQRADLVSSPFITTPEWNSYINQSYFELYDLLVTAFEDYNVSEPACFQTNGSSDLFALPSGSNTFTKMDGTTFTPKPFYKLLGVDCGLALSNNAWVTLHKFDFQSRNKYVYPQLTANIQGVFALRYRIHGTNILFIPTPAASQWIRLWFIPRMVELVQDTDLADGISGWTEYVIVDAAIKALQKQESSEMLGILLSQKQALLKRIESAAAVRDAGMPETISDVRPSEEWSDGMPPGWR